MSGSRFLFSNGVISRSADTPPVSAFLESHPGAYTTTRTHSNGLCLLFWERHLCRLANSARILLNSKPELLFESSKFTASSSLVAASLKWELTIGSLVNGPMKHVLRVALKQRRDREELAITTLVSGNFDKLNEIEYVDDDRVSRVLDVHVHIGTYVPPEFGVQANGAHLAVVGRGRDVAAAKYSDWVRLVSCTFYVVLKLTRRLIPYKNIEEYSFEFMFCASQNSKRKTYGKILPQPVQVVSWLVFVSFSLFVYVHISNKIFTTVNDFLYCYYNTVYEF